MSLTTPPPRLSRLLSIGASACIAALLLALPAGTPAAGEPASSLAIRVAGNRLVDAHGKPLQLRGINVSGLEQTAVNGWSPGNPWGGNTGTPTPNWTAIKAWGPNAVRLPLNEASWLGLTCIDQAGAGSTVIAGKQKRNAPGAAIKADPGGNYQATVKKSVAEATAAGLYVILDLHWTAPGNACPMTQNAMADADHSIAFWTSVAETFKGTPSVVFDLFNEPFLNQTSLLDTTPRTDLRAGGGTLGSFLSGGNPGEIKYTWHNAGMQQMLDAVRATGATNVVLTAPLQWAQAIDGWLQNKPTDPINQLGASWHAYPAERHPAQVACVPLPQCSSQSLAAVQAIRAAGFPVVITEFGDVLGTSPPPMVSRLLPFADANEIGYFAWTWDLWYGLKANILISDAAGTPTAGYGAYVRQHYLCVAAGTANCP